MSSRNLPDDLIVDILSRLPVKSLLRFRCVSKAWCALITDSAFVKIHLTQSLATNTNLILIFRKDIDYYSVDIDPDACEPPLNHPLKSLIFGPRVVLGTCNGLLCISNCLDEIYLWNPFIRSHLKLPDSPVGRRISYDSAYGFGYDSTSDDYKVIRAVDKFVIVYSLSTNSWRRIGKFPFSLFNNEWGRGVLVNSTLHWVAKVRSGSGGGLGFVVSFDLKDEEYREVPLPHLDDLVDDKFLMKVGVLGGQLCLLCNYSKRVEIWVMKDYGVRDSWVKQFSNEEPSVVWLFYYRTPVCYSKKGGYILRRGNCYVSLILYDPHTGRISDLWNRPGLDGKEIFVGSLVPLKMPKMELNNKKRKK